MPVLPFFTFASVVYCYLIWNHSVYLSALNSNAALYIGFGCVAVSILMSFFPRIYDGFKYNLFSVGCLIVWFADWSRIFGLEAPIFYSYPIYFALLSVAITHLVINQVERFDDDQVKLMRIIYSWRFFKPPVLAIAALISLSFPSHYLLYTVAMTFLLISYAFEICLQKIDG